MLDLRRLRLLRELHARGTIAAVADALQFTPSAVSQQLAVLERDAGVPLLVRAGRGVRLTDAALVLVDHAEALLDRAELAEAELAASAASVVGRGRIATFQSAALRLAVPAMATLAREAPGLRCELVEAEPEQALPELALGGVDLVLADEWQQQPHRAAARRRPPRAPPRHRARRPAARPIRSRAGTPTGSRSPRCATRPGPSATPARRGDTWWRRPAASTAASTPTSATAPTTPSSASPSSPRARRSRCCPTWCRPTPARASSCARIAGGEVHRTIVAATRRADRERPSVQALLAAVRAAALSVAAGDRAAARAGG